MGVQYMPSFTNNNLVPVYSVDRTPITSKHWAESDRHRLGVLSICKVDKMDMIAIEMEYSLRIACEIIHGCTQASVHAVMNIR
jgi:hypothetical protein